MKEDIEPLEGNALRGVEKARRREKRLEHTKNAPVASRYGIWTGEGYLREGESLERHLVKQSVKAPSGRKRLKKRGKNKK